LFNRIRVKLRALLPEEWFGAAGEKFRKTGEVLAEYSRDHIHPEDKVKEFPDLAWSRVRGEAYEKLASALKNFEDVESSKIANELARRTADDKAREAKASADKMESEVRLSQASEFKGRIELIERCRQIGVLPVWNAAGEMTFIAKALRTAMAKAETTQTKHKLPTRRRSPRPRQEPLENKTPAKTEKGRPSPGGLFFFCGPEILEPFAISCFHARLSFPRCSRFASPRQ
jgi:hypothetical protein